MLTKSASLIFMVKLPQTGELAAVCQFRGRINFEKNGAPESWAGGLQPMVHGKREGLETPIGILQREAPQEIGVDLEALRKGAVIYLSTMNDVSHYAARVPFEDLATLRLHPSTGGLCFLRETDLDSVKNLRGFPKNEMVPGGVLAMFPDDLQAVRDAFRICNMTNK